MNISQSGKSSSLGQLPGSGERDKKRRDGSGADWLSASPQVTPDGSYQPAPVTASVLNVNTNTSGLEVSPALSERPALASTADGD